MATNKSPLGLALDPETCAFCGKKVKAHSNFEFASCRAALKRREEAANAAEKSTLGVVPAQQPPRRKTAEEALEEYEEALRKEVLEEILEGETDLSEEDEKRLHADCHTQEAVDDACNEARDESDGKAAEAWEYLAAFGSHDAACLHGALVGTQALHPLCTCGWNEVATELERR